MKCPHCGETLPFVLCSECGVETPAQGHYCCGCGSRVKAEEGEIDFSQRILCRDGNCIGVINGNGICNVCRKPDMGEQPSG